jgi:hypothetical protein
MALVMVGFVVFLACNMMGGWMCGIRALRLAMLQCKVFWDIDISRQKKKKKRGINTSLVEMSKKQLID